MKPRTSPASLALEVKDLFSLPEIYLKVRGLLDDPNSSLSGIADVISVDPNMTGRILRIANSAYCGFAARVETVQRALGLLGTQQIHDLVLSTSVARSFSRIPEQVVNMEKFWRTSVMCGASAKIIADHRDILDSERMFTAGLLTHIGRLVLFLRLPSVIQEVYTLAPEQDISISQALEEKLGFSDSDVSVELLSAWNLPDSLVEPIRHQGHPGSCNTEFALEEAAIVHVASAIADAHDLELDSDRLIQRLDETAWMTLELTREKLMELMTNSESLANEVSEIFTATPA